eukprot:3449251-Amphidinium_carterae.3
MTHYLQTSLGAQSYAQLEPDARHRILALARLAPEILAPHHIQQLRSAPMPCSLPTARPQKLHELVATRIGDGSKSKNSLTICHHYDAGRVNI